MNSLYQPAVSTATTSPSAVILQTERLILRPPGLEDFDDSFALWSDPRVTRYILGKPSSQEDAWARLQRSCGHWALLGFGLWVVREKAGGRFVGEIGFMHVKRDLVPSFGVTPEIGWVLSPSAQGKGYASEAVQAVLRWSDQHWPGAETACIISPENAASIRIAVKHGYVESGHTTYKAGPIVIYRRAAVERIG